MKWQLFSVIFATLFLLMACSPKFHDLDSGLFTGKPCKAPCWQNLIPGKSTEADVDRFLNNLSTVDWPGRGYRVFNNDGLTCWYKDFADQVGGTVNEAVRFNIENGTLTFIESINKPLINLGDLVRQIGSPEYFNAELVVGPDGSNYSVEVYYPSQGLAFIITPEQNDVGYVKPSMIVSTIQYFAPGSLLSYFTVKDSCFIGQAKAIDMAKREITGVQPWSGFGIVKAIPTP